MARTGRPTKPFWDYVDKRGVDECWPWIGGRMTFGYGSWRGMTAHRKAAELTYGAIPDDMVVMHSCDNPPCVNPKHLNLGTMADNNADRHAKGRSGLHGGIRNGRARLTPVEVGEIRRRYKRGQVKMVDLADEFKICVSQISEIVRNISWKT